MILKKFYQIIDQCLCYLLSLIGKTMENLFLKYLISFLSRYNIITHLQSCFMPKDSTINQLIYITNDIAKALILERKSEFCLVISVKRSTGSDMKDISYVALKSYEEFEV